MFRSRLIAFPGDKGSAECTHNAGDIRTDNLTAGNFLKAAQDGVIVEGAALDDDVAPKLRGIGYLDDLEQGILDDGVGKTGRDVRYLGAFLLRLFYLGVHKYGTACPQVNRVLCKKRRRGKILYTVI